VITVAIVPVRDQPELTARFLEMMREQTLEALYVLDNGSSEPTLKILEREMQRSERVDVLYLPELGIYELWNAGAQQADDVRAAEALEGVNLLVCNNDVQLLPGSVELLADALRSRRDLWAVYPDDRWDWHHGISKRRGVKIGTGVARDGGLYGPCFMVALDRIPWRPLISDTSYEWWFGDNHLAREIEEKGGKHARALGVPVLHDNEGTARHHPETQKMRERDRRRWIASQRGRLPGPYRRRMPTGTKVWAPGGKRIDGGEE